MAKRAPAGEEPYRPLLDPGVISAALTKTTPAEPLLPGQTNGAKVLELTRPEGGVAESRTVGRDAQVSRVVPESPSVRASASELIEKLDQEKRMLLTRAENVAL